MTVATASARQARARDIALVGLGAGFLSGLFGIGGGLLMVPALVLVLHYDQRLANGTSLAAILPISIASVVTYWAHDNVDWTAALFLSIGAIGGALVGTKLLRVIPVRIIGIVFIILMLATAVRLFIPIDAEGRGDLIVADAVALIAVGILAGTLAGLLGVGGGIIMVPAMVVLFGIPPVVAKGTSVAVIIPTSLMGTWRNRKHRNADMRAAAILGTAGILSAIAGGSVADVMSDDLSNVLFAALLVIVSIRQWQTLRSTPAGAS